MKRKFVIASVAGAALAALAVGSAAADSRSSGPVLSSSPAPATDISAASKKKPVKKPTRREEGNERKP